jgi:hypothetical protein
LRIDKARDKVRDKDVTLVSGSGNSDIHTYQSATPTYTPGGQFTGAWQADGRFLDPLSGTRGNTLDVFNGKDPNGEWTLFFAATSSDTDLLSASGAVTGSTLSRH